MIDSKYPTSLQYDLQILESLSGNKQSEEIEQLVKNKANHLWRYKLAIMHRVNQKELLHNQFMYCSILLKIMTNTKKLIDESKNEGIQLKAK